MITFFEVKQIIQSKALHPLNSKFLSKVLNILRMLVCHHPRTETSISAEINISNLVEPGYFQRFVNYRKAHGLFFGFTNSILMIVDEYKMELQKVEKSNFAGPVLGCHSFNCFEIINLLWYSLKVFGDPNFFRTFGYSNK